MGQILKRKKKGRPSKADLAKRNNSVAEKQAPEAELRRSLRQRSVRYTFDFDDYLEDDELFEDIDEEEDERRREKKLKFLLKLQGSKETNTTTESTPSGTRRVPHAPTASQSSSEYGRDRSKPSRNGKIDGDDEGEEDEDENEDVDDDDGDDNGNIEDDEV